MSLDSTALPVVSLRENMAMFARALLASIASFVFIGGFVHSQFYVSIDAATPVIADGADPKVVQALVLEQRQEKLVHSLSVFRSSLNLLFVGLTLLAVERMVQLVLLAARKPPGQKDGDC